MTGAPLDLILFERPHGDLGEVVGPQDDRVGRHHVLNSGDHPVAVSASTSLGRWLSRLRAGGHRSSHVDEDSRRRLSLMRRLACGGSWIEHASAGPSDPRVPRPRSSGPNGPMYRQDAGVQPAMSTAHSRARSMTTPIDQPSVEEEHQQGEGRERPDAYGRRPQLARQEPDGDQTRHRDMQRLWLRTTPSRRRAPRRAKHRAAPAPTSVQGRTARRANRASAAAVATRTRHVQRRGRSGTPR